MVGTIRINLIVAALAAVFTFVMSLGNNMFVTTCLKSLYSFAILFVLTFGFRWVLGVLVTIEKTKTSMSPNDLTSDSHIGSTLDVSTPEEDHETNELLKAGLDPTSTAQASEPQFSPLNPPKLVTKNQIDPEQLAGALRRMSED
ncbi:hypothetical protein [Paenibacillus hexagrammi]|uniref:Transmembrane protein n=1 Tax=Paenibacillus hexagrammi TaxID=2908839 RepID=A0ABY3SN50_9BACL|nr:hypothetical protein [Paenibacillus sp. YPD9-1]UJF35366.1 hypothetical protein L0M14_09795 [Paenibacillus sp. YPD9-1]